MMPCQGCTQPLFCRIGAASASEISVSSAEEARREAQREAAKARQNARDLAQVFGPAGAKLLPELEEPKPAEEAMARPTPAHANNGNRKGGIKVNALLIVHQLCSSEHFLLVLIWMPWLLRSLKCGAVSV